MHLKNIEVFTFNDEFYHEIGELLDDLDIEDPKDIEDDMTFTIYPCQLEPIVKIDADWIMKRIDEERFTENGNEAEEVFDLLVKHLNFDKLNSVMVKNWYPIGPKYILTKKDVIEWCS